MQRLAAARPELKDQAVVLYEEHSRGLKVVACSASLGNSPQPEFTPEPSDSNSAISRRAFARLPIIRPGMPLAEALALAGWAAQTAERPAPDSAAAATDRIAETQLHLEAHDPLADRLALEQLAEWCQRFSPIVGLEDAQDPESLLLDVTGLSHLFGGEELLAHQIEQQFDHRGLSCRVAIADSIGSAWALAHCHPADGAIVVPAGQSLAAVTPLPLEALRLSPDSEALLAELGIRQIGQLLKLPRSTLSARFGAEILKRLDQLTSGRGEVIVARQPVCPLERHWLFECPTDRREMIDFAIEQLTAQLCQDVSSQPKGILRLHCRLETERAGGSDFSIGLFRPSASPRHLLDLIRLRMESLRLAEPVVAVRMGAVSIAPLQFNQQELFNEEHSREAPRALAALVDRLSSRLGRQAVLRAWLLPDAQPEYACQYSPLAGLPSRRRRPKRPAAAVPAAGQRPVKLYSTPAPIVVVAVAPDGPPVRFQWQGCDQRIAVTWGPERIETGWWRTRCVRRDYYRVETVQGNRFWLFRRLTDGQWFIQGEFD